MRGRQPASEPEFDVVSIEPEPVPKVKQVIHLALKAAGARRPSGIKGGWPEQERPPWRSHPADINSGRVPDKSGEKSWRMQK